MNNYNYAPMGYKEIKEKMFAYIEEENPGLTYEQKDKIFEFGWDHGHSYGEEEVKYWINEFLDLLFYFK